MISRKLVSQQAKTPWLVTTVVVVCSALMTIAGSLKLADLYFVQSLTIAEFGLREKVFQSFIGCCEICLGCSVAILSRRKSMCLVLLPVYSVYLAVAGIGLIGGNATCSCMGSFSPPTVLIFTLDLCFLVALAVSSWWQFGPSNKVAGSLSVCVIFILCVFLFYSPIMPSIPKQRLTRNAQKQDEDQSRGEVRNAKAFVGRVAPFVDGLDERNGRYIFCDLSMSGCVLVIERFLSAGQIEIDAIATSRDWLNEHGGHSPSGTVYMGEQREYPVIASRLVPRTPVLAELENGRVISVAYLR